MKKTALFCILLLILPVAILAQTRVNARDIIDRIDDGKSVKYENVEIVGDLDFTSVKEVTPDRSKGSRRNKWFRNNETDSYSCHVRSPITFINCIFNDDVLAYVHDDWEEATYNAVFHEETIFRGCEFKGASAFKYVKFKQNADFTNARFHREALFKYTKFSTEIAFSKAQFHDDANFKYTNFPEAASFDEAGFGREANFKYTKFYEGVSFRNAVFRRDAIFGYTKFSEPVDFKGVEFEDDTDFRYTTINGDPFAVYLLNRK
jgi:uncharacterized protein YjbI with pentapeptide repeats